jgi:hypothetical protein
LILRVSNPQDIAVTVSRAVGTVECKEAPPTDHVTPALQTPNAAATYDLRGRGAGWLALSVIHERRDLFVVSVSADKASYLYAVNTRGVCPIDYKSQATGTSSGTPGSEAHPSSYGPMPVPEHGDAVVSPFLVAENLPAGGPTAASNTAGGLRVVMMLVV